MRHVSQNSKGLSYTLIKLKYVTLAFTLCALHDIMQHSLENWTSLWNKILQLWLSWVTTERNFPAFLPGGCLGPDCQLGPLGQVQLRVLLMIDSIWQFYYQASLEMWVECNLCKKCTFTPKQNKSVGDFLRDQTCSKHVKMICALREEFQLNSIDYFRSSILVNFCLFDSVFWCLFRLILCFITKLCTLYLLK